MAKKEKNNYKTERNTIIEMIKHIVCLILPVIFAFGGYFLAPHLWILLNKEGTATEIFRFVCSIIFFLIPASIIFIETRTLNPIINITIKDNK